MNTLDFLKLVWPATGTYLILIPTQWTDTQTGVAKKSYKHFAYSTIDAAADQAMALANDRNTPHNVFFALGTVKEDLTRTTKADRDAAGKKVRGQHKSGHDNTAAIKAFWLDLDVDVAKVPLTYATRDDAALGIRGFCQAMGLPKPYVTSSGGGFHVYWPLSDEVDPDKWQHYANLLKQLAESWGLRADRSRTADRASILRPVGTNNWKTGAARAVQLVVTGVVVDTNQFLGRLAYLAETANLPPVPQRQVGAGLVGTPPAMAITGSAPVAAMGTDAAAMNQAAAAGAGYDLADPRKVVEKCQQLAWQAVNQPMVPEPMWYAMIGCLRHAQNGAKAVHMMSKLSPTYDPITTDTKIQQHIDGNYGPSLCATFEQHRPSGCDGCPFKGKIKTPLQLVRALTQVAPPTVQFQAANGTQLSIALPPPPKPFKRVVNPLTGSARIAMTIGDKTGNEEDVVVYEYDLYPSRLIYDERESRYNVVINRWLPRDGWAEFEVPTGKLYDRKQLAMTFGDIGVMPDLGMVEELVQYMIGYIRDLQKAAEANVMYAQLGWRPDHAKFVLPDRVVTPIGVETITPSKNIVRTLSWVEPAGSIDDWKRIVAVYERAGMEAHQFGFGVGFASPLFIHTNFNGVIVSMVGKAGAGKSSAAMSANSIWGHPTMGWADIQGDTVRAFYQKLGVLKNLPATYDEHTNLEGDVVSDLCYMVSKGQGRQRLQQSGQAQENHGNFQLMMLMTGNTSLNSRLAMAKADASAESARVFEYVVPPNTLTKADADVNWGPGGLITQNYGMAGEVYARQLMASHDWSRDRVKHWVKEIDRMANVASGERFWSAAAACVLTGFELANACGLTNCDIDRLLQFSVRTIGAMKNIVSDNTRSPTNIVADFINNNLRNTLVLASEATGASAAMMLHTPTDKLHIRLERHTGKLFIDRAAFRRFCGAQHIDYASVIGDLKGLGVLRDVNLRVSLGKGTTIGGLQTYCLVIDMKHPALVGVGEMVAVSTTQAVPTAAVLP